jgi:hypothetical protein
MPVGQDGILRGGWQPPPFERTHNTSGGPIANRPQLNKLPHKATGHGPVRRCFGGISRTEIGAKKNGWRKSGDGKIDVRILA